MELPEKIPVRVSRKHLREGESGRNAQRVLELAVSESVTNCEVRVYLDDDDVTIDLYFKGAWYLTSYRPIPNQRRRMLDFLLNYDLSEGEAGEPTRFTLAKKKPGLRWAGIHPTDPTPPESHPPGAESWKNSLKKYRCG